MGYGWEGESVRLVPLDIDRHFENCMRWMNDPEVTQHLLIGDHPITRLAEREWFDEAMKVKDHSVMFAIELLDGTHLGNTGIFGMSAQHRTGNTGSFIGERANRGKGFGTDAARVRARYAFDVLGLRMLLSGYLGDNERSGAMLRKVGFIEYGKLPNAYWKRGRFVDETKMYLDVDRWRELTSS